MTPDLKDKRVLLLGAETELGRAIAGALAESGARLALVGATNDAETSFAVQRLGRKQAAEVSQAIDATNDMAVRVMVRQVSKALGGLDAVVFAVLPDMSRERGEAALGIALRFAGRELSRTQGNFIIVWHPKLGVPAIPIPDGQWWIGLLDLEDFSTESAAAGVIDHLARFGASE